MHDRFSQLVERLGALRAELAEWSAYRDSYQRMLAVEYDPLAARLREKRIALARLFDAALHGRTLGKRHAERLREVTIGLVTRLLEEAQDPELVALHDRHASTSFAALRLDELESLQVLARDEFGIDAQTYEGDDSPEAFADWLRERIRERQDAVPPKAKRRAAQSARALDHEAKQEQLADGGHRAIRSIFRRLVSELHPDREADPAAREQKTALMQRANQAYASDDLLGLLELQLTIDQVDPEQLAALADDQLAHYVHVLEGQWARERAELSAVIAPFARVLAGSASKSVTPALVQRRLDADIRELKHVLRGIESELILFKDLRYLKASIANFRVDDPAEDEQLSRERYARRRSRRR